MSSTETNVKYIEKKKRENVEDNRSGCCWIKSCNTYVNGLIDEVCVHGVGISILNLTLLP